MPRLVVPVTTVAFATPRAAIVRLGVPDGEFSFAPGQAVSLGRHGQPAARFYSIASAPGDVRRDGEIEFLVGIREDGQFDAHLAALGPGVLVDLEGPVGTFGLPADAGPARFVFVAGGTGIAPLRSMWRHLVATRPGAPIEVLYSARTRAHFAYRDELDDLEAAGRITSMLTATREPAPPVAEGPASPTARGTPLQPAPPVAEGPDSPAVRGIRLQPDSAAVQNASPRPVFAGRICRAHLAAPVARGPAVYLVCGPPAFVAHVEQALGDLGVPGASIRKEGW